MDQGVGELEVKPLPRQAVTYEEATLRVVTKADDLSTGDVYVNSASKVCDRGSAVAGPERLGLHLRNLGKRREHDCLGTNRGFRGEADCRADPWIVWRWLGVRGEQIDQALQDLALTLSDLEFAYAIADLCS